jgi:MFS family permease
MVIRRIGARVWLPFLIIVWGAAVLGMGFVHSWVTLTVLRVILGIFEAGCRSNSGLGLVRDADCAIKCIQEPSS